MILFKFRTALLAIAIAFFLPSTVWADWITAPEVFEPVYYADNNDDVHKELGYDEDKLSKHWKEYGLKEGRRSSPVFDVKYYLEHNSDVAKSLGRHNYAKAAEHWYESGIKEGRPSHPEFRVKAYLKDNPDVAKKVGKHNYAEAIRHYLEYGYVKGRKAT